MKLILICTFLFSPFAIASKALTIMTEVDKRETGRDFIALYEMNLINGKKKKTRELLWWRLNEGVRTYNLIKIKEPKILKNTGLLIHSNKKGEDLTWLFLSKAAKREPRKIASNSKNSRFLGSEFYYIDFEESGVDEFTHSYVGETKIKDWSCDIILSKPKDDTHPYSQIKSYVDKATKVVVQAHLFKGEELEKVFSVIEMKNQDKIWTITRSIMDNKIKNKQTEMILKKIKYNNTLKKNSFSLEKLLSEI